MMFTISKSAAPSRRSLIGAAAASVALALGTGFAPGAQAQSAWPNRTITLLSPYAPGGTTDVLARMIAAKLQTALGQTVIVENKAGVGGNIGTDHVAKAKADGYTFLLAASGPLVIAPSLYPKLAYKPLEDFTLITPVASAGFVIAVHPASGLNSIKDIIAQGKAGKLSFASAGPGTPQHIIGEMFNLQAGVKITHIPYRGSGPALNDLIGGQVPLAFENPVPIMPHVRAGKLKVLAVTTAKRSSVFPDIPTVSELGIKGFDARPWYAVLAPANLPADIANRMNAEMKKILDDTEVKARLFALGAEPMYMSMADFKVYMASETKRWEKVVKESGATAD